jgi:Holliday junction resolvasome RuvABC endonuclease subunit
MTTRDMIELSRRPCYLGCDVQTTGMGYAAIVVDTGAVASAGWVPFARGQQLEAEAVMAVQTVAGKLDTADVRPVQIAVERVGGGRGVQSMLAVANAAGVVAGVLAYRYDTAGLWRPTPAEWKRACHLSGIAGKDAVRACAGDIIRRGRTYVTVTNLDDMRQDVADALCIAWADRQQGIHAVAGQD